MLIKHKDVDLIFISLFWSLISRLRQNYEVFTFKAFHKRKTKKVFTYSEYYQNVDP